MNEDLRGPASALAKLGVFSAALVALPLSAVSLTLGGYLDPLLRAILSNPDQSRATAAGVLGTVGVLVVLTSYVVMACLEEPLEEEKRE